jgi:hypothetical protein
MAFLLLLATFFKGRRQVGLGFAKNGYLQTGHIHSCIPQRMSMEKREISVDTKINFFLFNVMLIRV